MTPEAKSEAKLTISAVVIRADGTREDLGVISSNKVPGKLLQTVKKALKNEPEHK